jgi:hypothetical protein
VQGLAAATFINPMHAGSQYAKQRVPVLHGLEEAYELHKRKKVKKADLSSHLQSLGMLL